MSTENKLEANRIINGDCLEVMKTIPEHSIDMILCDLPFGTTKCKWDTQIDLDNLWAQYNRIKTESAAVILFAQPPFDKVLACSNLTNFRYEWIWEKSQGTGHLNAKKMPLKCHENVLVFYDKLPTYNPQLTHNHKRKISKREHKLKCNDSRLYNPNNKNGYDYDSTDRYPRDVIRFKSDKQKEYYHPTQKPVALCEYMINTYSNEGDIVLDNCLGSGTTAIACINTNRNYIGIETDPEHIKTATKRVAERIDKNEV